MTAIEDAAHRLYTAHKDVAACPPIRDLLTAGDIAQAYAVQEINTRRWLGEGRRLVGRKIGLTAKAVQKQLGVDQPDYGMLYADMSLGDGDEIPKGLLIAPKVEGEIAFVLGRDLTDPDVAHHEVMRAIDFAVAAIEVVDSRVANWQISIQDTIADNASSGMFVLGSTPKKLGDIDLWSAGMVIESGGEPLTVGAGAACLGNPINATVWLARTMAKVGRPLKAGDVVLSGALGPMVPAQAGQAFELRITGLGALRLAFGA